MKERCIGEIGDQIKMVIDLLKHSMDDYLYFMDLQQDTYSISESAAERFAIPGAYFENASKVFLESVHPADCALLQDDLAKIIRNEKDNHDLQYRWLDKNGRAVWINCRGSVLKDEQGNARYLIGCINEIGKKQKADNISGLLGESALQNSLQMTKSDRKSGYLLRIGIDDFKEINENKGIIYGDMVLAKTAEAIGKALSKNQKLFKVVADEFMVVDYEDTSADDAMGLYEQMKKRIADFIADNDYEVFYTISGGVVFFEDVDSQDYDNLMKLSEFALNHAKINGKNKCCLFNREVYKSFLRKKKLTRILQKAVVHDFAGFEVHFQPIMDIKRNQIHGAEALLRFRDNESGPLSPVEFVPILEESGLILPVGKWVMEQAMSACKDIKKKIPEFVISVNLSHIQVLKSNVLDEIVGLSEKYELSEGNILMELTESGFLESDINFINFCEGLKKHNIPLALDDFGTGYSNFHYLYNLSPDTIKIDRSFTLKALKNDYEYKLLKYMSDMTHGINLNLCIEGIETSEELEKIRGINPDFIQGFYFGKPIPLQLLMRDYVEKDCHIAAQRRMS